MKKLTDSDKQEILKLYRETAETTSTLAERYGVSNSTISRLLKSTLVEEEYEYLVSLKRAARTPEGRAQVNYDQIPLLVQQTPVLEPSSGVSSNVELPIPEVQQPIIASEPEIATTAITKDIMPESVVTRRVKTRSSAVEKPKLSTVKELEIVRHQPTEPTEPTEPTQAKQSIQVVSTPKPKIEPRQTKPVATNNTANLFAEILAEEILEEDTDDLDDDLDVDLYDDEEDFDEEEYETPKLLITRRKTTTGEASVQVLPLSLAHLPKTCYLVIDRSAELITRPLKDFGDLGQIPTLENQQRTLPIFDNHRVAKRFSTKRDRVIKIPDSQMLHKASNHLQAKGITRLLIDGQVYSLSV
ncbi:transposase [Anabaena sp. FACHB-1237]|uniref:transposase n=1 Tax=Anabaena sp. FACHB-1237 TaxID=2692769 RepID=UPI00168157EA|nr:transposase [Anabaena sp. FACHB-1237]MBD2136391.1 transposase [Anabaena sp. FACHB-1237]